jgi:N-acetylglucosamine-6-sulfatase
MNSLSASRGISLALLWPLNSARAPAPVVDPAVPADPKAGGDRGRLLARGARWNNDGMHLRSASAGRPPAFLAGLAVLMAGGVLLGCHPSPPEGAPGPAARQDAAPSSPPSIVLIYADDLRADGLAVTGHPFVQTPHLDRLAAEGVVFDNALVVTPLCCPSRASLLTGQYTHLTHVSVNPADLDYDAVPFLPRLLQASGYATAFIGKYHLGRDGGKRPGFDHWVSYAGRGSGPYHDPELHVDGDEVSSVPGFSTDIMTDMAVQWIRARGDGPFFLLLSLKNPHTPYRPPARHQGLYEDVQVPIPASFQDPAAGLPEFLRATPHERGMGRFLEDPVGLWRAYSRMIPSLDESVGRIYRALQEEGILDRTALIFTSDHGHLLGEQGLVLKRTPYEPTVRVPLIVRHQRLFSPGTHLKPPVLNVDIAPTILGLAGAPVPPEMSGESLLPLARGEDDGWRNEALLMDSYHPLKRPRFLVLRSTRWKYIRYLKGGIQEQLFDLLEDPEERHNRADDPALHDRLVAMRAGMRRSMEREGVPAYWWKPLREPWTEKDATSATDGFPQGTTP